MKTTDEFIELLEIFYQEDQKDHDHKETRVGWMCGAIFQIWTYDGDLDETFSNRAVEVCEVISSGKTFEYIENPENHLWYIQMVNMPFFAKRIEWGTSIRGAFWMVNEVETFCNISFWEKGEQTKSHTIAPEPSEWESFIQAIIQFSKTNPRQ